MLDPLRLERLVHDVGRRGERRLDIASRIGRTRQHVAVEAPHRVLGIVDRGDRIGDRPQDVVLDVHHRRRASGRLPVGRDDDREHVAEVRRGSAFGDEDRPVGVDDADPQLAGNVGRGEHRLHPGFGGRGGRVDAQDPRPRVVGEPQRAVQQAGHPHVVDVVAVAEREFARFVLHAPAADAARQLGGRVVAPGDQLHRVEDLHVARAPAEVRAEVARRVRPFQVGALLVDERLRPHHDAGRAEPALQRARRREAARVAVAFVLRHPFERRHRLAFDARERELAGDDGLAVEQHRAAAALAGGRAAVLGRGDVEFLTQRREQVRVVGAHADRPRRSA